MADKFKKICVRYQREMIGAMIFYLPAVYFSKQFSKQTEDQGTLILLALAPIAPLILAIIAFFRYYNNVDERERRIMADGAAITLLVAILGVIFCGLLESFGAMNVDMNWVGAFLIIFWSLSTAFIRRQR